MKQTCKSKVMQDILAAIDAKEDEGFEVVEILVDRPSMKEIMAECTRMNGGILDAACGSLLYGYPLAEQGSLNGFMLVVKRKPAEG